MTFMCISVACSMELSMLVCFPGDGGIRIALRSVSGSLGTHSHSSVGIDFGHLCVGPDILIEVGSCSAGWVVVVGPGIGCRGSVSRCRHCLSLGRRGPGCLKKLCHSGGQHRLHLLWSGGLLESGY